VKGVTHILAKNNKGTIGTIGSKMTLQDSFTKGLAILTYPKLLIFLTMICFHIVNNTFIMDPITISLT
jgi:hypothetical protein